jgi:hypothetical protein
MVERGIRLYAFQMFWAGLDEGWGKFQVAKVRGADFRSNGD